MRIVIFITLAWVWNILRFTLIKTSRLQKWIIFYIVARQCSRGAWGFSQSSSGAVSHQGTITLFSIQLTLTWQVEIPTARVTRCPANEGRRSRFRPVFPHDIISKIHSFLLPFQETDLNAAYENTASRGSCCSNWIGSLTASGLPSASGGGLRWENPPRHCLCGQAATPCWS